MVFSVRTILYAASAAVALAAPAQAHRNWLQPSATTFSGTDAWVSIDAAESSDVFLPVHRALGLAGMKVWAPDGSPGRIQNGVDGHFRTSFDVQLDQPGTWAIGMATYRVFGSFKMNGEEWRLGRFGRPGAPGTQVKSVATIAEIPAGATDIKISEMSGRNLVFVTAGAPTTTVFKATGKGLEMEPITHPDELVSNETAKFRYLVDGKPAAGLPVVILPAGKRYIEGQDEIDLSTGADGVLTVKWPRPGMYWIGAAITDQHPSEPRANERRLNYIMTVDVLAP